jgi:DNA modification methylase
MLTKTSSLERLNDYFLSKGIEVDLESKMKGLIVQSNELRDLPKNIILRIIAEAYGLDKPSINEFSKYLEKMTGKYLLWLQKEYLKRYIDYGESEDYYKFQELIKYDFPPEFEWKTKLDDICNEYNHKIQNTDQLFLTLLKTEMMKGNEKRVKDYIVFLYSRLVGLNEFYYISLKKLFDDSKEKIKNNISKTGFNHLQEFCKDENKFERMETIEKFSAEYLKILREDDGSNTKKSLIYFNIDQSLLNSSRNIDNFYDKILSIVSQTYNDLQNHKTFAVRIRNIISNNVNIKWKIFSILTTYAETFNVYEEKRSYYSPSTICKGYLEHRYNFQIGVDELKELESYFKGKVEFNSLLFLKKRGINQTDVENFRMIITGYSFSDSFVLVSKEKYPNSNEVDFIDNNTELLLIFHKNEIDDRKIPCPVCGSFNTSGNSFPEVGIRSWECKNPLCFERSKSNRGKRFSLRSNLMQGSLFDLSSETLISKEIIKKWRKDIVRDWTLNDLYYMLVKYFTFVGDKIGTINCEKEESFKNISVENKRAFESIVFREPEINNEVDGTFKKYISESEFVRRFFYSKLKVQPDKVIITDYKKMHNQPILILGSSEEVLTNFSNGSIHNMVTSPPYYNAREYSQWSSFYQYLNDMFQLICVSYQKLIDGGIFFYNVGDTYGNPNTIIESKMGEKRIALGAYIMLLFELAGFEVLDNIVWDKGEPQSNRHKNDGKYTPYYQRPANCYEHIFIFKKNGTLHLNKQWEQNKLKRNIQAFSPVIKIGSGGENRYGHTAPFPPRIPELSLSCFTNEKEIVLDPYSGSGTTAITATLNNRIGIGIEKSLEYHNLSLTKSYEFELQSKLKLWEDSRE